jgi:hypothetical protein
MDLNTSPKWAIVFGGLRYFIVLIVYIHQRFGRRISPCSLLLGYLQHTQPNLPDLQHHPLHDTDGRVEPEGAS